MFRRVAELLSRLESMRSSQTRFVLLDKFYAEWDDDDYFPLLRLLLPSCDRERPTYGIREKQLARIYGEMLGLQKSSSGAAAATGRPSMDDLLQMHSHRHIGRQSGDFSANIQNAVEQLCGVEPVRTDETRDAPMSVAAVNEMLDALAAAHSHAARVAVLRPTLRRMSAFEHRWLVRIIMRTDLNVGRERTVLLPFHPDAVDSYNVNSDLKLLSTRLADLDHREERYEVELFRCLRPMLADRRSLRSISATLRDRSYVAEVKFDGERVQIHVDGGVVRVWSRNAKEHSRLYADPIAHELLPRLRARSVILDGELLAYDSSTHDFVAFGTLRRVAKADKMRLQQERGDSTTRAGGDNEDDDDDDDDDEEANAAVIRSLGTAVQYQHLCLVLFDLLYLDGESFMMMPLSARRKKLESIVEPRRHYLELAQQWPVQSADELGQMLETAVARCEEGIMIKDTESTYVPGERKDKWLKLKPDYVSGLGDMLDLLIVGGTYGSGRRGGTISAFLLGLIGERDANGMPTKILPVARVGSGYSDVQLAQLQHRLSQKWREFNPKQPPSWLGWSPGEEKPDLYVEPQDSAVISVMAAQIVPSTMYHSQMTLRFPRARTLRVDKAWHEAMTLGEFQKVASELQGRHARRGRTAAAMAASGSAEGPQRGKRTLREMAALPGMTGADVGDVAIRSQALAGLTVCVMDCVGGPDVKAELERLLHAHGGDRVQQVSAPGPIVVADRLTVRVRNLIDAGLWDVVRPGWVRACAEAEQRLPFRSSQLLHGTDETKRRLTVIMDQYGDEYVVDATVESLKATLQQEFDVVERAAVDEIDLERPWWGLFRAMTIFFAAEVDDDRRRASIFKEIVYFYGAKVVESFDRTVSHVIVPTAAQAREYRSRCARLTRSDGLRRHILPFQFLIDTVQLRDELDEAIYERQVLHRKFPIDLLGDH